MTHRERVLAAISHRQPDRVPIDLAGTRDSSIVVEGYERLKEHFGVRDESRLCSVMMRVVDVHETILQRLDIDTRSIFPGELPTDPGDSHVDAWGVERVRLPGTLYYDQLRFPLSGQITVADIARHPWPDPDDPKLTQGLRERAAWIRTHTDCASILTLPSSFVHLSQYLRGFEDWYCDFVLNTTVLDALFDAILEVTMQMAKRILAEVGDQVDVVICADDLGAQDGLQISHDHYAKHIRSRHEKYFRQIHEMTDAKLLFHSCGSVASVLDDFVEIGVDILNPVQTTAAGMDPVELKKKYAGRLAFWGAMDTQNVLPHGSVDDVKRMVEERIEQLGDGGGYVLASCHNIQPDVPLENVLAMFQHARDYVPPGDTGDPS
jgi:uroporphyrinogen decarboxylase